MAIRNCEVAVVGAGIGGMAAALALAQRGARVTVYETAAALTEVGAGLQIGPNGVAVLEALGLGVAAGAAASVPQAIELRDGPTGRAVARAPLGAACAARYGRPYWQFHRADLLATLVRGVAEAGVRLRTGTTVAGVTRNGDDMRLDLCGGGAAQADLIVGADGVRSGLRGSRFDHRAPRFTGHVAWRGLVPAGQVPEGSLPNAACVHMGPGRHLVTYPLRGGSLWNFVAVEERADWTAESWTTPDDPAALRRAFAGWCAPVATLLAGVHETYLWGLFDHPPLSRWVDGRVALVGDACHPMLPFLAQGAAMALEDGWVLAETLAAASDLPTGLATYEARRKRRATRVQRAAARNGRLYHLATPGLRNLAHLGLRTVSALAPGMLLGRFDWLYGANVVGAARTG